MTPTVDLQQGDLIGDGSKLPSALGLIVCKSAMLNGSLYFLEEKIQAVLVLLVILQQVNV